eukprot:TRINITY_DN1149_c1_g1_i1.p1 TRINITY_DN1149_c1_g1~~TRINITY_DN1149_c1_g1_i1.p1  ORF type:complete len:496 (+),score=199.44 TRINITY_DN1149_c1_g1_i1:121-1608(+)
MSSMSLPAEAFANFASSLQTDVRKLDLDSVGSFFVVPRHIAMRTAEGSEEEDEASDEDLKGEMAFEMYKSIAELSHSKTLDDIHVGKAPFCPDSPDGICYRIPSAPSKPTPSHAVASSSSSTPTTSSPSTSSSSSSSASSSSGVPAKRTFSKLDAISKRGLLYAMPNAGAKKPVPFDKVGKVVDQVLNIFETIRNIPPNDMYETEGKFKLKKQIFSFVAKNQKILMVLPAFPCKSPNLKKVLGTMPDGGEETAIKILSDLAVEIEKVYAPGCQIVIMSDGRVFADLVGVDDETVSQYEAEMNQLIAPFPHLSWDNLDVHFPSSTYDQVREKLTAQFEGTLEDIEQAIKNEPESTFTYRGFIKFLQSDREWGPKMTTSQIKKFCGITAKNMLYRNKAFSKLVNDLYPTAVRLSIHAHTNAGPKYGVRLVPDLPFCITPWHNVLVEFANGSKVLMKRETAESIPSLELFTKFGRPWSFVERSTSSSSSSSSLPSLQQ